MPLEDPPIAELLANALQPLQDRISTLENTIAQLKEENAALTATASHLEENQLIQLRLIARLREATKKDPGKTAQSRADKIARYLASMPSHKATFETLKGYLGIDKVLLNQAVKALMASSPGKYGITRTPGDKRKRTLVKIS
jgi:regulator of replication initiation timing